MITALAACSSPSPVVTIFDDERTADDELPAATSSIDGFVSESSRLLWTDSDVAYYAAQGDGDPGMVICLIAVEGNDAEVLCSARVPIGMQRNDGSEVSFGETAPSTEWTKRGDYFWSRD